MTKKTMWYRGWALMRSFLHWNAFQIKDGTKHMYAMAPSGPPGLKQMKEYVDRWFRENMLTIGTAVQVLEESADKKRSRGKLSPYRGVVSGHSQVNGGGFRYDVYIPASEWNCYVTDGFRKVEEGQVRQFYEYEVGLAPLEKIPVSDLATGELWIGNQLVSAPLAFERRCGAVLELPCGLCGGKDTVRWCGKDTVRWFGQDRHICHDLVVARFMDVSVPPIWGGEFPIRTRADMMLEEMYVEPLTDKDGKDVTLVTNTEMYFPRQDMTLAPGLVADVLEFEGTDTGNIFVRFSPEITGWPTEEFTSVTVDEVDRAQSHPLVVSFCQKCEKAGLL